MKLRFRRYISIATLVILSTHFVPAQSSKTSTDLRDLQDRIRRMEAMDIGSMAPSTLEIYERTLIRLYERVLPALQQQIDLLASIEAAADANDTEAAKARDELAREKRRILDKVNILGTSLRLSEPRSTGSSGADSTANASSELPTPAGEAALVSAAPANPASSSPSMPPLPPSTTAQAAAPPVCDSKGFSPVLTDEVNRLARSILINDEDEITGQRFKLVFYTIADALNLQVSVPLKTDASGNFEPKTISFKELEPYKYLGETLRIDKHLGSSSSSASVSGIDRPGFAWLLGLALENGQVEKDARDSVLTFSTSPAALFMLNKGNDGNAYQNAGWLNRVGLSASFNIANQNQLLGNATRSQLREYSVKYRFAGDRSPRSKALERIWDEVAGDIKARLIALNNASQFISTNPVLQPLTVKANGDLKAKVLALTSSATFKGKFKPDGSFTDGQVCGVSDVILTYLKNDVASQANILSPGAVIQFKEILVPNFVIAQERLRVVRDSFNVKIDKFFKGPLGTVSYISHREPVMGNFSEFKLLFEQNTPVLHPLPLKTITANAGFSFYHQPNPALKQERLRAFNAALSFEGNSASPFTETLDLSRITYSFVGNYQRMFENGRVKGRKADLASAQFLMGIPLFKGMGVPFSVTYSNATETDRRKGWRVNFGLKMDTDKLLELVRAAASPQ